MKILFVQSGGPSPASNAALAGAALACDENCELWGAIGGWAGVVNKNYLKMRRDRNWLKRLSLSPSPYLVTFRDKLPESQLREALESLPFEALLVVGGEGSAAFLGSVASSIHAPVALIAKTVDNDMGPMHHDQGYPTAAWASAEIALRVRYDSSSYLGYVEADVIQTMGRDAGWLALAAGLAAPSSPDLFLLPELDYEADEVVKEVKRTIAKRGKAVIAVAEGLTLDRERGRLTKAKDYQKASAGQVVKDLLGAEGIRARFEWPGILYRCVPPIESDRADTMALAAEAVKGLKKGESAAYGMSTEGGGRKEGGSEKGGNGSAGALGVSPALSPSAFPLASARKRYVPISFVDGFKPSAEALYYLKDTSKPAKLWDLYPAWRRVLAAAPRREAR